jgi:hypothetical protein
MKALAIERWFFYRDSGKGDIMFWRRWVYVVLIAMCLFAGPQPGYAVPVPGLDINVGDVSIYVLSGASTVGWAFDAHVIPEPSTMLLLGSGLIGLVGLSRKFKKK